MWLLFDHFSKRLALAAAEGRGTGIPDAEISPDAQRADFRFEPDRARRADRADLGLLGRLMATPCLFEFFSEPPSIEAARACLSKHLIFWRARPREARKKKPVAAPRLWILSAGRPVSALRALAFVHARGFPLGVYRMRGEMRAGLVVASELPRDRSMLLVRLLAAGRGLPEAMKDLSALPPDAPEHALATPVVLSFTKALTSKHRPSREEREFIMGTQNIVQELVEKGRREGQREALREVEKRVDDALREGRREGRREALREGRLEGRRKEARAALRSVLTKRGLAPSAEDEAKVDACTRTATLRRWLDQAIDAVSVVDALK